MAFGVAISLRSACSDAWRIGMFAEPR
jgi:hypothetical protein